MPELSPAARRALKSRAHHLAPYLSVGTAGLTSTLLKEIDLCLDSHELIKIRAPVADRRDRDRLFEEICRALGASPVQHIGKVLVLFRARVEDQAAGPRPRTSKPTAEHAGGNASRERAPVARKTHGTRARRRS